VKSAETAAADQLDDDAQYTNVGGGTPIDNLGHTGAALTGQPVAAETAAADQGLFDAHRNDVGGGPPIAGHVPPDAQQADAGKAADDDGQLIGETHKHDALSPAAPDKTVHVTKHGKKIREFWRHPPRTEAQKEAARTAAMVGGSQWREYGLDKVRYRELDQFIRDNAEIGTINVVRGVNNFQKAALAALIQRHVVPIDQGQLVTELVSDHELQKYVALAIKWAPKYAATRARADADDVIENVKMIAAE